jgi:hypothetical protein
MESAVAIDTLRLIVRFGVPTDAPDRPRVIAIASAVMTRKNTDVHTQNISHHSCSMRAAWMPEACSADWMDEGISGALSASASRAPSAIQASSRTCHRRGSALHPGASVRSTISHKRRSARSGRR